ncbi:AI-2E family transporter [Saliphagus sp. GCM10025334]
MNRSRGTLLVLIAILLLVSAQLVLPYIQYVLAAVLLAFVLTPVQRRLEQRTSPAIAAFSLVLLALLLAIVPVVIVVAYVFRDAQALVEGADADSLPLEPLQSVAERFGVDLESTAMDWAQSAGQTLLERSPELLAGLTHTAIGIGVALFLLYYLLRDGDSLLRWLREVTPLPDAVQTNLFEALENVTWAVLAGHVLIALVQGGLAGIGLFVVGIPNSLFWTVIMIVLSLIPIVGSFLVWGPAVIYLLLINQPAFAIGLAIYSMVIVGLSDDYLRPIVVDRYAELNPAVIIVGVLGGVTAFGFMGLFYGPIVLGALVATLEVFSDDYGSL